MLSISKLTTTYLLVIILFFSLSLRIVGLNWDQNQHLHPDERFLTMVVGGLKWPKNLSSYLDSSKSTLNPNNQGFDFYVYGTFPTTLNKWFSEVLSLDQYSYNNITLTGRLLSIFFDLGTLLVVYGIAKNIFNEKTALLSAFIYGVAVLPIQLSHFFTVDPPLVFFLNLSFYFILKQLRNSKPTYAVLAGIFFGVALASKISAILFVPIVLLGYIVYLIKHKKFLLSVFYLAATLYCGYLLFRILDPHAFSGALFLPEINSKFIFNLKQLKDYGSPDSGFPPIIQWISKIRVLFPLKNLAIWGLGIPQFILLILGLVAITNKLVKRYLFGFGIKKMLQNLNKSDYKTLSLILLCFWVLYFSIYQLIQFTPSMRYFYPIYPMYAIIIAYFSINFVFPKLKKSFILYSTFYILILIWPLSFIQIYKRPHSRISASKWIYENIPPGSTISCEHWDDCLPLTTVLNNYGQYNIETVEMFNPDTAEKWSKIDSQLKSIDYLIFSSNRVWGSVPKVPQKYPISTQFYDDLFSGKLQFVKVAEITSYPTVPVINLPIIDDSSEEAFTVYDHPKILIYKKTNN